MIARQRYSLYKQALSILQTRTTLRNCLYSTNQASGNKPDEVEKKEDVVVDGASEELKKLNETVAELTEKYKRSLAETENVRMRLRKEASDAKVFGIQSFCKDLLNVADIMKMAVNSIPEEKITSETDKVWTNFFEGVTLTDKELHKVFERHGLVALAPSKGDKFDPNEHEALFESPIEGMDPGLIAHVQRIGYKLKDRTLRAAQVGVSGKH